jgi:hypothetical protein
MKSGYTLYDDRSQKLEITLDDNKTVTVEAGDISDWEHAPAVQFSYEDFREFMKDFARQFFDISGEN